LSAEVVEPEPTPSAFYLASATTVPADVTPQPASAWARVDLDDLPLEVRAPLSALDLNAAWRLIGSRDKLALNISTLPLAAGLGTLVERRETTTLLTTDGTLLYRERYTVVGKGSALDIQLPTGSTLWSAGVNGQPVRPIEQGGVVSVPLGPSPSAGSRAGRQDVEIIAVLERALPLGRSQLAIELPTLRVPVVEQSWIALLPEGGRYRFRSSELERVNVGESKSAAVNVGRLNPAPVMVPQSAGAILSKTELQKIPTSRDPWTILESTANRAVDRISNGQPRSVLSGVVRDGNGQALPGVTITLGKDVVQVTDRNGTFQFFEKPGTYPVTAQLGGFSRIEVPAVFLEDGKTAHVEIRLQASVEDVITVEAESPLLDERRIRTGLRANVGGNEPHQASTYGSEGLVAGVKPLAITVPESGKSLRLIGILPPSRVTLVIDVRNSGAQS
jgi:hypothetical protein